MQHPSPIGPRGYVAPARFPNMLQMTELTWNHVSGQETSQQHESRMCQAHIEKGYRNAPRAILSANQAAEIYCQRTLSGSAGGLRTLEVAEMFCVSPKTVRDIWNRRSWAQETRHLWVPGEVAAAPRLRKLHRKQANRTTVKARTDTSLCNFSAEITVREEEVEVSTPAHGNTSSSLDIAVLSTDTCSGDSVLDLWRAQVTMANGNRGGEWSSESIQDGEGLNTNPFALTDTRAHQPQLGMNRPGGAGAAGSTMTASKDAGIHGAGDISRLMRISSQSPMPAAASGWGYAEAWPLLSAPPRPSLLPPPTLSPPLAAARDTLSAYVQGAPNAWAAATLSESGPVQRQLAGRQLESRDCRLAASGEGPAGEKPSAAAASAAAAAEPPVDGALPTGAFAAAAAEVAREVMPSPAASASEPKDGPSGPETDDPFHFDWPHW
jgi:hypothetical protein